MAPIPKPESSTVRAIYAAYEVAASSWDSLGISVGEANNPCDRALWYAFRWASPLEKHHGRQLRLFETGNLEESRLVEDLERIGVDVYGQQDKIRLVQGHVRGKCDGKAMGVVEAPKTEHLLEFKSSNAKGMKEIIKKGCKEAKPLHYGQCQLGLHAFGLSRCLYLVSCKDDDTLYAERIEYDPEFCLRLLARLERIINSPEPPSCIHSSPEMGGDGHWSCARWAKPISFDEQKEGCPTHLTIPALVPGEQTDCDEEAETITYVLRDGTTWIDGATNA